jgi:CheY-like chemotaxis protein
MDKVRILWADDEIDLLKPHILFLEEKGFEVLTTTDGSEVLEFLEHETVDIVFLDENMPGLSGIEVLSKLKESYASLPVVMITKSEEEYIMEDAIGSKISDYLIKPVNPNQILLSIKKNLKSRQLISEKTTTNYQAEFRNLSMRINDRLDYEDWKDIYKKLTFWEMELEGSDDESMLDILLQQKEEANVVFAKFVQEEYLDWINQRTEAPLMSHEVVKQRIAPIVKEVNDQVFLLIIDNMRYDQWKSIEPLFTEYFNLAEEELYYSILPTATSFSRNALLAGMLPSEIESQYNQQWNLEDESKRTEESVFFKGVFQLMGMDSTTSLRRISGQEEGKKLLDSFANYATDDVVALSYNFVDMLSHSKTEMEVIKELADDEAAYRSLTRSWFSHSYLRDIVKKIAEQGKTLIVTTDHGSIRVKKPSKVVGDKNTNSNLRYKQGKKLDYNPREVFEITNPDEAFLPKPNVSTRYVFATKDSYFVYPNNYNHFVNFYKDTFQHGGVSMEEMLCPFAVLKPKG